MKKTDLINATYQIDMIADLLQKASHIFEEVHEEIRQCVLNYHNETATLPYCIRWGLQAAQELHDDWHTLVSKIVVDEEDC